MSYSFSWQNEKWMLGVLIYIFGTTAMALGANLQRMALTKEAAKPLDEHRPKGEIPLWLCGIVMFSAAGIFLSVGLIFASQTLLAPMILLIFPSNALFAHFLNGEHFSWCADGIAILAIMLGVVLCEVSAPRDSDNLTAKQFLELYGSPSFIMFVFLWSAFTSAILIFRCRVKRRALESGAVPTGWEADFMALSYGAVAGALGAMCTTLTKSVFELIGSAFARDGVMGVLSSPLLWLLAFLLMSNYVLKMKWTVHGLEACSAMLAVSTQTVTEEIMTIAGGILYFQDYRKFDAGTGLLFAAGNLIAVLSLVALAHFQLRHQHEVQMMQLENPTEATAINAANVKMYALDAQLAMDPEAINPTDKITKKKGRTTGLSSPSPDSTWWDELA